MNDRPLHANESSPWPTERPMCVFISGGGKIPIWFFAMVAMMLLLTIGLVVLKPALPFKGTRLLPEIVIGVMLLPFILLTIRFLSIWTENKVYRVADELADASDVELAARLGSLLWRSADLRTYRAALQLLFARGFANRAVVFYETNQPYWRPTPIRVPFEPTPLDEANATFNELESGLRDAERETRAEGDRSDDTSGGLFRRRIKRNITVSGLWLTVIILSFLLVMHLLDSVGTGRIDSRVLLFIFALVATVGTSWYRGSLRGTYWFLVPGGLVFRKPRRRSTKSDVHVFARSQSVLIFRSMRKQLWTLAVWDGKEFGMGQVSEDEVNLLLRAWYSPLPPPPVEKLVDLT